MKDTQILSAFQELASELPPPAPPRRLLFDACHVGVVLRAVLSQSADLPTMYDLALPRLEAMGPDPVRAVLTERPDLLAALAKLQAILGDSPA